MPDARCCHYDVHKAWPIRRLDSADDCIDFFLRPQNRGEKKAFHGAYRADWNKILSSLDVHFERRKTDPDARRQEETKLLELFVEDADPHLSPDARRHIEVARSKWNKTRTTGTLYVARHHGLPTRCVDWTDNGLTALFFACRRVYGQDGIVWWMNYDNFTKGRFHPSQLRGAYYLTWLGPRYVPPTPPITREVRTRRIRVRGDVKCAYDLHGAMDARQRRAGP